MGNSDRDIVFVKNVGLLCGYFDNSLGHGSRDNRIINQEIERIL